MWVSVRVCVNVCVSVNVCVNVCVCVCVCVSRRGIAPLGRAPVGEPASSVAAQTGWGSQAGKGTVTSELSEREMILGTCIQTGWCSMLNGARRRWAGASLGGAVRCEGWRAAQAGGCL